MKTGNKMKILSLVLLIMLFMTGCKNKTDDLHIEHIDFESEILGKKMNLKVYLPDEYTENIKYPVLYFFPDGGGSVYTVINQYEIAAKAQKLINEGRIMPLIIAAVDIDRSFGVNSADVVETVETITGKIFEKGRYEDYFIKEIIPFIDSKYSTDNRKEGRYIGGYSMGGFAALHIALRNPELFCKAGGHSPSIFTGDFPDKSVSEFLFPTQSIREERDPIYIIKNNMIEDLELFLDVEAGGSPGVKFLYDTAVENKVAAQFYILSFSHGRMSCNENMEQYLVFYSGRN